MPATITITRDAVLIKRERAKRRYIAKLTPSSVRRLFALLERCEQSEWPNRYNWKGTENEDF